jgi:two-component sensor histidine kinase
MRAQIVPVEAGGNQRVIGVLMDITDRKRQEEALAVVSHELRHRIKNSLTVVAALARRAITSKDDPETASRDFMDRVAALGAATDLAFNREGDIVELDRLVERIVAPYEQGDTDRIVTEGPKLLVPGQVASKIALALHELCTNAVKYGALSVSSGHVQVRWAVDGDQASIRWAEHGGPPVVPPAKPGFGSRLLQRGIFSSPDAAIVTYASEGLKCDINVRLYADNAAT